VLCGCSVFDSERLEPPFADGHDRPDAEASDRDASGGVDESDAGAHDASVDGGSVRCESSEDCSPANATALCLNGECLIVECTGRFRDCDQRADTGCEASLDDVSSCGGCSNVCKLARAIEGCEDGVCIAIGCDRGYDDCDGSADTVCETEAQSAMQCGTCGGACALDHAVSGCEDLECTVARCDSGFGDCDGVADNGCEEPLATLERCGDCDTPCDLAACSGGVCSAIACDSPDADCDADGLDCEVNLANDVDHCGACNARCELADGAQHASGVTCADLKCAPRCDADFDDCDADYKNGCETATSTLQDCGSCGNNCALLQHTAATLCNAGGVCEVTSCDSGYADCDGMDSTGCEVDTHAVNNCGGCASRGDNEPCAGLPNVESSSCGSGSCVIDVCAADTADCDGIVANGCESAGEIDSDGDGELDCTDECPNNALSDSAANGCGLGYIPANLDVTALDPEQADATTTIDCAAVLNTSATPSFTTWCGGARPQIVVQAQPDGPELAVVTLRHLILAANGSLRIQGSRPAVLVVFGAAGIAGTINASASGATAGAGGNVSCGTSQGVNGTGSTDRFDGATGGGGGGFGTAGGRSGRADTDGRNIAGASGGAARGSSTLTPLVGGCAGGQAGDCATAGGAGGGALQIVVSGTLTVSGTIQSNGAAGATPCGASDEGGGTGGGSGGAIRLEANTLSVQGATLQARGGNGGGNGTYDGIYDCGGSNGAAGSTSASSPGSNGGDCQGGSVGGGGGYGRVVICNRTTGSGC
jgi:hypothetical protein